MSSVESGIDDLFHFPFGFSFHDFRWGLFVIGSMRFRFLVLRQEIYVKDRVDVHRWGEC